MAVGTDDREERREGGRGRDEVKERRILLGHKLEEECDEVEDNKQIEEEDEAGEEDVIAEEVVIKSDDEEDEKEDDDKIEEDITRII